MSNFLTYVVSLFLACLLTFLMLIGVANAKTIDCDRHPIYCNIVDKKPNIKKRYAMRLSNFIHKYSRRYKQDPHISIAIGMQETNLRQINRKHSIILFGEEHPGGWKKITGYSDICMFQFHVNTITSHGLDPIRLKNDIEYCVEQHFILMRHKRKVCRSLGEDSWTCYHSRNKIPRELYKKLVERYL